MSDLTFGDFYSEIRSHFSSTVWDYEKFKNCEGIASKVEYLIGHSVVQKSLDTLNARNTQIPLCAIFGPPVKKNSPVENENSQKYPQMSKKVEVKVTKKKGRMLVAKERIQPGRIKKYKEAKNAKTYIIVKRYRI